jgi:hypothetical protein
MVMSGLTIGVESRPHPVYRLRAAHWATVYQSGSAIFQKGPYRDKREAMQAAWSEKQRRERSMKQPHIPGPRVDLPGQLEIPAISPLDRRPAAQSMRPTAPQKPCDIGLFSDDAAQLDLVEMARKSAT